MKQQPLQSQMKKPAGSHDKFFKRFYSNPQFALELFRLIFSKQEIEACDWKKLKTEKDTLQDKRADLVFSVPLHNQPEARIKIFILLEHKSSYNKDLFKQLLSYQALIYEQHSEQIISVIPVLFYHGKRPWTWKRSFQEAFLGECFSEIPAGFRRSMLNYRLKLLNTHDPTIKRACEDRSIKSRGALSLLARIWFLKHNAEELKELVALFSEFSGKREDLILSVVNYLKSAVGLSRELWERVEQSAIEEGLLQKGGYMDIREEIREEGRLEGIRKGRQEVVLNMLKKRTKISFISEVTGLSEKEIKKLKNGS